MRNLLFLFLIALCHVASADTLSIKPDYPDRYVVVKGDTLVSVGHDGWSPEGYEMFPGFDEDDSIIVRSTRQGTPEYSEKAISEQDFISIYTDTLLSSDYSGVSPNHQKPIGLEVIQRSYAWSYSYAEDFIIFDYGIRNIGLGVGTGR